MLLFCILNVKGQSDYSLELNIKSATADKMTINETGLGVLFSNIIDTRNSFTNAIRYKKTKVGYDMATYNLQHDLNDFNSLENDFIFNHEFNSKTSVNINLKPTINFETNVGFSDIQFLGGASLNYYFNAKNNLSIGVARDVYFSQVSIVPTIKYSALLTTKTMLSIGFPNSQLTYSHNQKNIFTLNNKFQGAVFNLDKRYINNNTDAVTSMTYSQMATTFEYARNLDKYWSINFQAGYNFNNNYYFSNSDGYTAYDFNNTNGYTLNVGLKFNINKQ